MKSGKVGFFFRRGGKSKTGRDAIALSHSIRSVPYIDAIVESQLGKLDQILAANYSRYFRRFLLENTKETLSE